MAGALWPRATCYETPNFHFVDYVTNRIEIFIENYDRASENRFLTHDVPSRLEKERAKSIKFQNYFHEVDGKEDAVKS